jgi:hypothetical protein
MLPELKFNDKMMQALIDGKKTVTRRKESKDICGGLYVAAVCTTRPERIMMKCLDSYTQKISEMTEEDAKKDGFSTLEEFKAEIASIYGQEYLDSNPAMWVYEFNVIGQPVPTMC